MKIVYIVPGFGGTFYCHNCRTSVDIVNGMKKAGHEAVLAPMYIPLQFKDVEIKDTPIFYGALNVYLAEKFPFTRNKPLWMYNALNSGALLKWISKKSSTTEPSGLENMTISVMRGEEGGPLEQLIEWLENHIRPDVVHLSNALLIGIGNRIKEKLKIPVFCSLDDENFWIDKMREPYRSEAWGLIKEGADTIDAYISASGFYAGLVCQKTKLPLSRVLVVPRGIDPSRYDPQEPSFDPPVIGFLSRMCENLGLDILIEAFIMLKKQKAHQRLRLRISGGAAPQDRKFLGAMTNRLRRAGVLDDTHSDPDFFQRDIKGFFKGLTLLSVPARKGESFGSYILESMASGIPVVQPRAGGYPEIIENKGGGVVYDDNTPEALFEVLSDILKDRDKASRMSREGLDSVRQNYSLEGFINSLLTTYKGNAR